MHIQSHVISTIPVFDIDESLDRVMEYLDSHPFSHIAISEKHRFLGVLNREDTEGLEEIGKVESQRYNLETFFVRLEHNWLDVLETFARNETNLLPVLNDKEEVIGYYDLTNILEAFIDTPFFTEPGGILVVAKGVKDYSFSEIAQIIEGNNAKIIGGFITDMRNDLVQLTLKITTSNLNEIIQTFRRYNYSIIFGNNEDQFMEDLKQRSDYLDKYLNV